MKKQKNKQEKINKIVKLAFITDSGYAMPTVVAIQSAICNKKDDSIYEVNILGYQLSEYVKEKFYKLETLTNSLRHDEYKFLRLPSICCKAYFCCSDVSASIKSASPSASVKSILPL